ncbi:hypothetical protein VCHA31O73_360052 [Vibrio chagasii]|nr:hypothetical protein VCHA31O73_360052 [Vibrio chagasii]
MEIPKGIIISDVSITQNIPVYKSVSSSEKVRVRDRGIHYLTGKMTLTSESPRIIEGFLLGLRNSQKPFELDLGNRLSAATLRQRTIYTTTKVSAGSTQFTLENMSGSFVVGDYFRILNKTKLYMITTGGTNADLISFYPPLADEIPSQQVIEFDKLTIKAMLEDSSQTITYKESGGIGEITVNWREVT